MQKEEFQKYKQAGRSVFRKKYGILVFLCLILSLLGTEGGESVIFLKMPSAVAEQSEDAESKTILRSDDVYRDIVNGDLGKGLQTSNEILSGIGENIGGFAALGRTNGVLAGVVNAISAGRLHLKVAQILRNFTSTDQSAARLFLILDLLRLALIWIFIRLVFSAILRRLFLEARIYDKIPLGDVMHFASVRRHMKASWTMFVKELFLYLWRITIVGGFIKHYSYYAVPYIVAENPDIGTREAIRLSREMMDGHKKEAFLFDLSYIGWILLGFATLGISDMVYGFPYRMAGRSEYYVHLRELAKERNLPASEKLNDTYLFEPADNILLYETYFDVVDKQTYVHEHDVPLSKGKQFASRWLGVWLGSLEEKKTHDELEGVKYEMYYDRQRRDARAYPTRLNPLWKEHAFKLKTPFTFLRSYSVWTLALLFLFFCLVGWTWEVSLYLARGEGFVNRGMMHGPWLPIYGAGGILVLMLCSRWRKHPIQEFFISIALCGGIEYLGAWMLETKYHEKWWSYEGNFLNLHGRICAEGLLVFGIACMLIVYLIAPLIDFLFSFLKKQVLIGLAIGLFGVFLADLAYSSIHPNLAKGAIVESAVEEERLGGMICLQESRKSSRIMCIRMTSL